MGEGGDRAHEETCPALTAGILRVGSLIGRLDLGAPHSLWLVCFLASSCCNKLARTGAEGVLIIRC